MFARVIRAKHGSREWEEEEEEEEEDKGEDRVGSRRRAKEKKKKKKKYVLAGETSVKRDRRVESREHAILLGT